MAQIKITMIRLKRVLQLLSENTSQREICKALRMGRGVLHEYKKRALATGLGYKGLLLLPDDALQKMLQPPPVPPESDIRKEELRPLLPDLLKESGRPHVTILLLWEEYIAKHPDGYQYTQFKKHFLDYKKGLTYTYTNLHIPGEYLQLDYAGDDLHVTDLHTGVRTPVKVLCCVLPYRGVGFLMALPDARMEHTFYGASEALAYFGGVPQAIISDNMSQWVKKVDRYEPLFTDASLEFSLHYNTDLDAARVRHPKDKAAVESIVNKFYIRIYAKIRDEVFYSLKELNARLWVLVEEYNNRKHKGQEYSKMDLFRAEEQPLLRPLPEQPFRFRYRKDFKVPASYHVSIGREQHQYSIPYEYINQQAVACWDYDTVEIYVAHTRVALHPRSHQSHGHTTTEEHMPRDHREYRRSKAMNAAYFSGKAAYVGPYTHQAIDKVLASKNFEPQRHKTCWGILSLATKYGPERLEAACRRLSEASVVNYTMLRSILEKRLENQPADQGVSAIPLNDHVRGALAYH
jgi:transposase